MYAVVESGGKQYRVTIGQTIDVEKVSAEPGETVTLDKVLLVGEGDTVKVGQPTVENASVSATVLKHGLKRKVIIWHFMPKHHSRAFPEDLSQVFQILVSYLGKIIPEAIKVDVYPPPKDWEVKLLTVVARKIKKNWTYDYDDMKKYLPIIGIEITKLMVKPR